MSMRVLWCLPCLMLAACPEDEPLVTPDSDVALETETAQEVEAELPETVPETEISPEVEAEIETTAEVEDTAPETSSDAEVTPTTCAALTLEGALVPGEAFGTFKLGGDIDLGLGGPLPDAVVFEFYSDATGSFDLGAGANANYMTCEQCVRFVQDIDETGATTAKSFFQKGGTLTIDPTTPPEGTSIKLELADLEMVEVLIRTSDLQSFPVDGGACYAGGAPIALETEVCVPACGDHTCGSNGCGGSCGECGAGTSCNLDGKTCEAVSSCLPLALDGELDNFDVGYYRLDLTDLGYGAFGRRDFLQIEFYKDDVGVFDLGASTNRNYATCNQCVRVVIDGGVELFQRSGQLGVGEASKPQGEPGDGQVELDLNGIVLEEVVIDEEFNSMPVPQGVCVEITNGLIASD